MADRILLTTWLGVARGHEAQAVEVFNEMIGLLGGRQQAGEIDSVDVALMGPNRSLDGFIAVRGSAQQILDLREDLDFRRATVKADLHVEGLEHLEGYCNEGVAEGMQMFAEVSAGAS